MSPGKLASQAGHAYLGAYLAAPAERQAEYHSTGPVGTKVCLVAPSLSKLMEVFAQAQALGLPAVLIEDTGRNTSFNGVPTVSAVGIGPIFPGDAPFLKRLKLHA
jgi:peptidyl-tRNA hydrolase